MSETSSKSEEPTLPGFDAPTSSPGSADGTSPLNSPGGPSTAKSGQEAAHASHSHSLGKAKAKKTSATSGPSSSDSSLSAALASSLANRLHQRLGSAGSMEYSQTWKEKVTPAGRRLWAHTASGRRISDSVFIGSLPLAAWPQTPTSSDGEGGVMELREGAQGKYKLRDHAHLAGWKTAMANDAVRRGSVEPGDKTLNNQVMLGGWMTPKAMDGVFSSPRTSGRPPERSTHLQTQAMFLAGWPTAKVTDCHGSKPHGNGGQGLHTVACGVILDLFLVPTGRRVVLAPEFSLWLMGFPVEAWVSAAPGATAWRDAQAVLESEYSKEAGTRSSRVSPPSSSGPSLKLSETANEA